jgi:uncharacterized membrane protein YfcA
VCHGRFCPAVPLFPGDGVIPELSTAQWILGAACALLVGFSKTGVAGIGIVIVPIMAEVFDPKESTAAMLLMLIVGDVFAVAWYRRHAVWRTLISLLPWVMPGILLGWYALGHIDERQFKPALGALILVLAALQILKGRSGEWMEKKLPHAWWFVALVGFVAGFATMLGNAAGGIMSMFLLAKGLKKHEFMGTSAWFYFIVNLIKVPFSANLDLVNPHTLSFAGLMIPAITAGAVVGVRVLPILPQKVFDGIVVAIAVLASVRLIVQWP